MYCGYTLMSQNIMTCLICCWTSVCCQNSTDLQFSTMLRWWCEQNWIPTESSQEGKEACDQPLSVMHEIAHMLYCNKWNGKESQEHPIQISITQVDWCTSIWHWQYVCVGCWFMFNRRVLAKVSVITLHYWAVYSKCMWKDHILLLSKDVQVVVNWLINQLMNYCWWQIASERNEGWI